MTQAHGDCALSVLERFARPSATVRPAPVWAYRLQRRFAAILVLCGCYAFPGMAFSGIVLPSSTLSSPSEATQEERTRIEKRFEGVWAAGKPGQSPASILVIKEMNEHVRLQGMDSVAHWHGVGVVRGDVIVFNGEGVRLMPDTGSYSNYFVIEASLNLVDGVLTETYTLSSPGRPEEQISGSIQYSRVLELESSRSSMPSNPPPDSARPPAVSAGSIFVVSTFRDCPECPEMVTVPEGSFMMGSTEEEQDQAASLDLEREMVNWENPRREISISEPFSMGMTEVTVEAFRVFVTATRYRTDAEKFGSKGCNALLEIFWQESRRANWRNPGFAQSDDHPVVCVSWNDAQAYVQWLSDKTGRTYQLPTEAQWEYAARAQSNTVRYWGDDPSLACKYANTSDQAALAARVPGSSELRIHDCDDGHVHTSPVGTFQPNGFGLYDMLGNVFEWVDDCWEGRYDPSVTDARSQQAGDCSHRGVRGGGWDSTIGSARAASRNYWKRTEAFANTGFRVVSVPQRHSPAIESR